MTAKIQRNAGRILISTSGKFSRLEAERICARVEALLSKTTSAQLIFVHSGKLALELNNYAAWETLLACLKAQQVQAVCFVFEKENAPFRFLAQEYARRAAVPCIQRDSLEQVALS